MLGQAIDIGQRMAELVPLVPLLTGTVAAGVTAWAFIWALQPYATRLGLLDHPHCERKDHGRPTPVTGGLGMILALALFFLLVPVAMSPTRWSFLLGALVLIVVGLVDDIHDLRWWWRILAQVVAALLMVYLGDVRVEQLGRVFGLHDLSLGPLSVPFTVFATVGMINAVNMIDGADGIGGMLVSAALLMLAAAAWYAGHAALVGVALAVMAVVVGFLAHNFPLPWRPKARVFMGNAGSGFLGFAIIWISFRLTQNPGHPVSPVLALWLIPIPVMDCLVLIVRRWREGRSPFDAGRDHIHHIMRDAGFSAGGLAIVLTAFSLAAGLAVAVAMLLDIPDPLLLAAFLAMCGVWYWLTSRRERAVALFRALRSGTSMQRVPPAQAP
ncbi:MAG: undecaprenyl/decaprenyl-phosphate alpha-N-acetylglucosaminyl 1-phosphate transferase [Burkholderiaceae bacterium]|nr:undecaprenyl/decaprenyl-phosphate alpha-N-acetylglucosaminyl 1-phosphate transferase [Burkholderiaceae bacterium]